MNYAEAEKYLEGVSWLGIKPGLERISELLARLGNPERICRFVHVAGTNGKGSTSTMLASMLTSAGYRTGLYTSPHLLRVTERMRVDGAEMPREGLAEAVSALQRAAEGMAEPCTEFELLTAAAFWWFAHEGCDYVVLEHGRQAGRYERHTQAGLRRHNQHRPGPHGGPRRHGGAHSRGKGRDLQGRSRGGLSPDRICCKGADRCR